MNLLDGAIKSGAIVIGVTNAERGPLAKQAQIPIVVPVDFDHAISVNTYSTLAAAASALATAAGGDFNSQLQTALLGAIDETSKAMNQWRQQIANASWLALQSSCYFLARGASLASYHEARLL